MATTFLILFLFLLFIGYAILIDFYRRKWKAIPMFLAEDKDPVTKVAVIIPFRNEAVHLPALLHCLQTQEYPKHLCEYIFIDDHSTDPSVSIIHSFNLSFPYQVLSLNELEPHLEAGAHKKRAINAGIKASQADLIITTDADCTMSSRWIYRLVAHYENMDTAFIAAPVKIISKKKSFVALFQTMDFLTLQGITGAAVYSGFHSLCNGANLAYTKQLFEEVKGFEGIEGTPSGDDVLLMQKIRSLHPETISYCKHPEAIVSTAAVRTWSQFFSQRIRWASKAKFYTEKNLKAVMAGVYLLNLSFLILVINAFFSETAASLLLIFFIAKILIEFPFLNAVMKFFHQQRLEAWFIIMQPAHILYTITAGAFGLIGKYTWKDRKHRN